MSVTLDKDQKHIPEEDLSPYLRDIRQFPMLTAQQERTLAMACAQGDQAAVRKLVNSNLRLVVAVAKEYAGRGVALLDLIQEGSIGLLVAAKKFDYTLEYRFSTYATKWIRQRIQRCIINHAALIRVPRHTAERIRKILYAQSALRQENGTEPTLQELAAYCEIDEDKVAKALELLPRISSLDAPAGDDDATVQTLLEDLQAPQPLEELVRRELKTIMDALLSQLTERQQQVLRLRFGMVDGQCHTLENIGAVLGISKERARQLEEGGLARLQKLGASLGLEDFLE